MNMGERLRKVLKDKNMSQRDLADLTDIDENSISRYITKGRKPSADGLILICKALNISADWLLGLKEDVKR